MPQGLDLFSWSLPFLADKIGDMMDHLLKMNTLVDKEKINSIKRKSDVEFKEVLEKLKEE